MIFIAWEKESLHISKALGYVIIGLCNILCTVEFFQSSYLIDV